MPLSINFEIIDGHLVISKAEFVYTCICAKVFLVLITLADIFLEVHKCFVLSKS